MISAEPMRRAAVISTFDLPDAQRFLIHGCEDCACATSEDLSIQTLDAPPLAVPADSGRWVRDRNVIELPLDPEHRLLFNPLGAAGVVVLNTFAQRIFLCFDQPSTLRDIKATWPQAHDEVEDVHARLSRLAMIHPVDQATRNESRGGGSGRGTVLTAWLH